jgi:copper oxidase (laccase) domain-containing protein
LVTAEQIHGKAVALVTESSASPIAGVDGLLTTSRGITLGISVADCAPVWLVARDGSAGGLLHSGKKGTELGIVPEGIRSLCSLANLSPPDLILLIGPCIRPPCYEVDFAAEIRRQAHEAGVTAIHDERICTACHPERYYSYRRELGLTGRMLATLTLLPR